MAREKTLRRFHGAQWDEPIIMELGTPGERGILPPLPDKEIREAVGTPEALVPPGLRRRRPPALPEISQPQVLRHFLRLSQETMGQDISPNIGFGTCTMKYSPKINESFVRSPQFAQLHPRQDDATVQGLLEIVFRFEEMMKEISGLDAFSFQPGGGGMGIFSNAAVVREYFRARGEEKQRTEIITTILSHPINAAAPSTKGFDVISLMPGERGYPTVEDLKRVVSEKTAAIFITNPEDTGVFNPLIREFVDIVHQAGGLCVFDMADYNGLFGIIRAREMGADLCHFNLHKAFASPHGSMGPGCAAQGAVGALARYLPGPRVVKEGETYRLIPAGPDSIGQVRQFCGALGAVLRAYAWVMSLGSEGLKEVAEISILNNNYMMHRLLDEVEGIDLPWSNGMQRLEQARYSFEKLRADTGVGVGDVNKRVIDFGFQNFFMSHRPMIVPEPFTPEPAETYSKADIDEYVDALRQVSWEAYHDRDTVLTAPHNFPVSRLSQEEVNDPEALIATWRVYRRKRGE